MYRPKQTKPARPNGPTTLLPRRTLALPQGGELVPYNKPITGCNPPPVSTAMQPGPISSKYVQIPREGYRSPYKRAITSQGVDWLKLAFAAPDFPVLAPRGVPDKYTGRTLPVQFRRTEELTIGDQGLTIVVPPIPGWAYFSFESDEVNFDNDLVGRPYPEALGLFPGQPGDAQTPTGSDVVTAFRYMSQLVELVPTTNQFKWAGSIRSFKLPVRLAESILETKQDVVLPDGSTTTVTLNAYTKQITGLEGINASNQDQYIAPSNLGVFTAAHNLDDTFEFSNTFEMRDPSSLPTNYRGENPVGCYSSFRRLPEPVSPPNDMPIAGFGGLETVVIIISRTAAGNTFTLRNWAAMECQINPKNSLYQYTTQSPEYDEHALAAYNLMVRASPVAVSYYENGSFWDFIKKAASTIFNIAKPISAMLSTAGGPIGAVAGGVNTVLNALSPGK